MIDKRILTILSACVSLCGPACPAVVAAGFDIVLNATELRGLRSFDHTTASAFLLGVGSQPVKFETEDRTIGHFSLNTVTNDLDSAELRIPLSNFDPEPPLGTFGVLAFYGDGVVSPNEWDLGTLIQQFTEVGGQTTTLIVNVSSTMKNGLMQRKPNVSFNFRGGPGTDRYFLGGSVGLPDSTILLHYVPEPSTLLLLGFGAISVLGYRKSRREAV
jgi:hypothetical protein